MSHKVLKQAALLLVCSSLLGAAVNSFRGNELPWLLRPETSLNPGLNKALGRESELTLDAFQQYAQSFRAVIIDARAPDEYARGHVAGAVNIPSTAKETVFRKIAEAVPRDGLIIIYCGGGDCEASNEVYEFLLQMGYSAERLKIFRPGWELLRDQPDVPREEGGE